MKKAFVFLVLLTLLLLPSCVKPSEETPRSIFLEANAFAPSYEVDAELNLEGVSLRLVFADGRTSLMRCDADMIVGFDTTTTGQKSLHAEYKGLKSNEITYQVYNPESVSREVLTPARIAVSKIVSGGRTTFSFALVGSDIGVRAFSFRLRASRELSDTLSEIDGQTAGKMDDLYWKKTASNGINVLISSSTTGQKDGVFFTLEWESEDVDVFLSDITVSDGKQDYYLPKAQ